MVIPAYDETVIIGSVLEQVQEVMEETGLEGQVIVVDDGSSDGTVDEVVRYPAVRLVKHPQNRGYGAALKTGIRQARHDAVVILDADGTYLCEMIPRLAAEIGAYDMAVGARTGEKVHVPLIRRPAKWALNHLADYLSWELALFDLFVARRARLIHDDGESGQMFVLLDQCED